MVLCNAFCSEVFFSQFDELQSKAREKMFIHI